MNKKSNIAKSSWWLFAIIGILIHLVFFDFDNKLILILMGALNGAILGWLLGYLFDYIMNSLLYNQSNKNTSQPNKDEFIINNSPKQDFHSQEIKEKEISIDSNKTNSDLKRVKVNSVFENNIENNKHFSELETYKIIKGIGWGKITLGTTKEKVDTFLLDIGEITSEFNDAYFVEYQNFGIEISYSRNNQVQAIFFYNNDKGYEHMTINPFKTDKNIDWKSTIIQVKEEYPFLVNHLKIKNSERIVFRGIDFRFLDKKLVRIGISK